MKKHKIWRWLFIAILIIGFLILKTYRDAGEFKKIHPYGGKDCRLLSGVQSSEDITFLPDRPYAFVSSDDRRAWFRGEHGKQGAIFGLDLSRPEPVLAPLTTDFDLDFHPHGIGLYAPSPDSVWLFVVNHRSDGHYIEVFRFTGERLVHLRSVSGALMHSPNDVIPIDSLRFYVTNDHGNRSELGRTLEEYLQLARSFVLYYDGSQFHKVAEGLAYANGINLSADRRTVYVAATVAQAVYVYQRNPGTGELTLQEKIDVHTGVDNVEVDKDGNLWLGAHPKLLTFVAYSRDPGKRSPSQVVRIRWRNHSHYDIDFIYLNDGSPLSGSSVAAVRDSTLLIGSVFDPAILWCKM